MAGRQNGREEGLRVSISVRRSVGRFLGRVALLGGGLLGLTCANAQDAQLDAALARVKLTDLSARPCDPKAVWRLDITDSEALSSWRSFLDATNPIIRKILYSGCDGIQTLVADIQFKGRRIAVSQLATNYDEPPSRIIRDPAILARFEEQLNTERVAEKARRDAAEKKWEEAKAKERLVAEIEADRLRAEEDRKKEIEIAAAMQIGAPAMAPYHVRECHRAEGKPRSPTNLTERDICEVIFRAGLSKPDAMVYASNVSCQVTHKKGEIPLARCRYDYDIVFDRSKRKEVDPASGAAEGLLRFMGWGNTLDRVTASSVLAGSAKFGMPKLFYFDILKKQWEPNGDELKNIYSDRVDKINNRNREMRVETEYKEARDRCAERRGLARDECNAKAYDDYLTERAKIPLTR